MKKYVRTDKGNLYERLFKDGALVSGSRGGVCDKDLKPIDEVVIVEADTIEELCDEFVIVNENVLPKPIIILPIQLKDYKNETIYGAIWTDKGLIYVAKMNEKGELCLI